MPHMTIEYDEKTNELLKSFKKFFGVKSKVEVIRRSLALARAAKKFAVDGAVRFENPTTGEGETYQLNA